MIGLDLGTTNCKAVLLDADGRVVATASDGYKLQVPHPGWAEQDVRHVWEAVKKVLRAVADSPEPPGGICFSGAMHSLFPIADAAGTPMSNAMTWADARATAVYRGLIADTDTSALYRRTGCPVHSTYHLQRLRWWNRVEPETAERAYLWVGLKDWILHALTGVWASDLSLASTTGLLNLETLTWDTGVLRLAEVLPEQLPHLVSASAVVGGLTDEAATATGLPAGLPVIAGGSDGAMASFGTGIARPGQTVITVGTSGAVRKVVGEPWFDPGERTFCYLLTDRLAKTSTEPLWFIGGAINNGGLTLQWVREKLYPELDGPAGFEQLKLDAEAVAPGAEGVFLLPYFAGERSPHWAPKDKGMLYGLGMQHTRGTLRAGGDGRSGQLPRRCVGCHVRLRNGQRRSRAPDRWHHPHAAVGPDTGRHAGGPADGPGSRGHFSDRCGPAGHARAGSHRRGPDAHGGRSKSRPDLHP